MNDLLYSITSNIIENYRLAKNKLRFDGEYINHFTSLMFSSNDNIDIDRIKNIRKYIKTNTNKMSSFRGDMLYMLSVLISKEKDYIKFSNKLIAIGETLKEKEFQEGPYLALSAYAIAKHENLKDVDKVIDYMKVIYDSLKSEYKNFIDEGDYLVCALIGMKVYDDKGEVKETKDYIGSMFDYLSDLKSYSKNDLQGIASSILLNNNPSAPYEIKSLIKFFNENNMKIGDEVLPLIGVVSRDEDPYEYFEKVKSVIECLCDEEGEYAYYMDKTFRTLLGIVIIEIYEREKGSFSNNYLEELLCFGVYSFIVSKNQGLFEEVLA